MKTRILTGLLSLLAVGAATADTFEGIPSITAGPGWAQIPGTVGWGFRANTDFEIHQLGVFNVTLGEIREPVSLGLWNQSGSLLASIQVGMNNTLIGQWRYGDIAPVSVTAGDTYFLGAYAPTGAISGKLVGGSGTSFSVSPEIQFLGLARSADPTFEMPELINPGQALLFAGPNFRSIPEPSSFAFFGLSLALAAGMRFGRFGGGLG